MAHPRSPFLFLPSIPVQPLSLCLTLKREEARSPAGLAHRSSAKGKDSELPNLPSPSANAECLLYARLLEHSREDNDKLCSTLVSVNQVVNR